MPAELYKCMYVIPKEQYESLQEKANSKDKGAGNQTDSGIGGNVSDSHVHNIDVSNGGTLVITDKASTQPDKNHNVAERRDDGVGRKSRGKKRGSQYNSAKDHVEYRSIGYSSGGQIGRAHV